MAEHPPNDPSECLLMTRRLRAVINANGGYTGISEEQRRLSGNYNDV